MNTKKLQPSHNNTNDANKKVANTTAAAVTTTTKEKKRCGKPSKQTKSMRKLHFRRLRIEYKQSNSHEI